MKMSAVAVVAMSAAGPTQAAEVLHPQKITKAEVGGAIFNRPQAVTRSRNGRSSTDVVVFTSPDGKYQSGMYKAGPSRSEFKSYGDDEYMYFVEGGVTLTSADGQVTEVGAGEAVTLPKGWAGVWETKGYTKFYVTYDPDHK